MNAGSLSRRRLLAGAATTIGGAAVSAAHPTYATAAKRRVRRTMRADVVIIGAGLSGMTAAESLHRAGVRSIVVLEAGDHIGGRTVSRKAPGSDVVLDLGAQFVGPRHTALLELAARLDVEVQQIYNEGENLYRHAGRTQRHAPDAPPPAPLPALLDFAQAQARFEELAATVPPEAPLRAPGAADLDAQTVETWIRANMVEEEARTLFRGVFGLSLALPPRSISLLHALAHTRANTGLSYLFGNIGGAQDSRFVGGSQQLAEGLAKRIGRERVLLRCPVREIDQAREGRVVVRSARATVIAQRAVCAFPLGDAARIRFVPELPVELAMAQKSWQFGTTAGKVQLIYDRPFWRDQGLTGQWTATDLPNASVGWDNSPAGSGPGILLTFLPCWREPAEFGVPESTLNDPAARRKAIIDDLVELLGPEASRPRAVVERSWHAVPYIGGVESPHPPGLLSAYGEVLHQPLGRVHWAGSETSHEFDGYMEGAVRAGQRVSRELRERL